MLRTIKLYFTDKAYYEQRKRYMKRQKAVRKKLKKQAKDFCPWSGYYMHEIVKTMLEFYHKTYLAGDCCWSEDARRLNIANSIAEAIYWSEELERIGDLKAKELIEIAKKDKAFNEYVATFEKEIKASNYKEALLGGIAEEYLTEMYTKAMYKSIGEHIWDWCD